MAKASCRPQVSCTTSTSGVMSWSKYFACRPGIFRPGIRTPLPGLWLAGDYLDSDYPATLESAVRSGVACATAILAEIGHKA